MGQCVDSFQQALIVWIAYDRDEDSAFCIEVAIILGFTYCMKLFGVGRGSSFSVLI